jgi:hypothetical protein
MRIELIALPTHEIAGSGTLPEPEDRGKGGQAIFETAADVDP